MAIVEKEARSVNATLQEMQTAIKEVLTSYTEGGYGEKSDLKNVLFFDDEHSRYLVRVQGTEKGQKVNDVVCHVEILKGEIILIVENNSDQEIKEKLVQKGINRNTIRTFENLL
ncbi:element excision factor XisI family protein [Cytophagaceae bacterium DM2B3-1]|uniref:Element excision factor XisI family protein n=1 Tax=Xanthocytophaga flava TaxID=3048013 RepID=A0ABT7CYF6_9BACT|nr:element excision factor XisI family protein [Xanthocytophaga flavus]MDJ1498809.1 element excision factor XisI family protein [Xanthocytophaga flavus]